MATHGDRPTGRRIQRLLLRGAAVLLIVGGLGVAWVLHQPTTSKACILGAPIDDVGGSTPEAARARWRAGPDPDVDLARPDRTSGSGDRITATYDLAGPEWGPVDPARTYVREVVTERGEDDVWRVVGDRNCELWTTT